ncbi:MAG: cobyrinate a,c-diamide synthase [Gemmatimonadales bacterium]|nr:cobyrinate a,c-diamide synthase [Gemmatimonadales bacterium]
MDIPRILIAGVRGGSGKTLISLGLLAAWRRQGHRVAPFKKGPDYIDAAWLSSAAGRPCRNLDLFLMSPQAALGSFAGSTAESDVAVIEGNRGLYDGMDAQGSYSTAELAKLLGAPVVLSVDCTKATRTVAAVVLGCQRLDPQVPLKGVILNQAAGPRHESVLREAVESACGLPVVGVLPRIAEPLFPERHLGLVPPQEHGGLESAVERAAEVAEEHLDLQAIWDLAEGAPALEPEPQSPDKAEPPTTELARIGVFRDAAFQFYYPDNLEALTRQGARLIEVSPIRDVGLPEVDALYIGGGFPETLAPALAENRPFRDSLHRAIEAGLPVYAECGGTVYLGEKLLFEGKEYPMVGALPVVFAFRAKPQGHGYTVLEAVAENPFYAVGERLRGHEFHYTYMQSCAADLSFAFRVHRGHAFDGERDGLSHRNVLACYTHVHALGTESWAPALVKAATRFSKGLGS